MDRRTYLKTAAAAAGATSIAGCNTGGSNTSTGEEPSGDDPTTANVDDDPEQDTQDQKTETTGNTDPMEPSQLFSKFPSERTAEQSGAYERPDRVHFGNSVLRNRQAREVVDDEIIERCVEEAPDNVLGWGFLEDGDIRDEAVKLHFGPDGGHVRYEVSGDGLRERFENNPRAENLEKISEDGDKITYEFDLEHRTLPYGEDVNGTIKAELDVGTGDLVWAEKHESNWVQDLDGWFDALRSNDEGEAESVLEAEGEEGKVTNYIMDETSTNSFVGYTFRPSKGDWILNKRSYDGDTAEGRVVQIYLEDGEIQTSEVNEYGPVEIPPELLGRVDFE